MKLREDILAIAVRAKAAARAMASADAGKKNLFLTVLAALIKEDRANLERLNQEDCAGAEAGGLDKWRIERMKMGDAAFIALANACLDVAALPDPVGATETQWQRPNGLLVGKMRIPIGVIAMIYEARPGVTIEAASLALKAGNTIILRGGRECWRVNERLAALSRQALRESGLPEDAAQAVLAGGREAVPILCGLGEYIDLMIPRGGEALIRAVAEAATMPVLMHYKGVCHAYIDKGANLDMALNIVENSKTQRPGVCNALECLLVHKDEAAAFLPLLAQRLARHEVQFRADAAALPLLGPAAVPIAQSDLGCEFMAQILAVVIVPDMDAALAHIDRYGSRHTEIICTENYGNAMRFLREADASMVAVNASTRFNDGGQLGLGAEIGISTTKIHAYGPMGVKELTTAKYVVLGSGQIRS